MLDTPVGTQLDLGTVSDSPVLLRRELAYAGSWPTREIECVSRHGSGRGEAVARGNRGADAAVQAPVGLGTAGG